MKGDKRLSEVAILIGIPGSGKSTYAKKIADKMPPPVHYISTDEIRKSQFGDITDMSHNTAVFVIMKNRLLAALKKGESVILDATLVKASERAQYIKMAKSFEANITAYYLKTDLATALKRNASRNRMVPPEVLHKRFEALEEPREDEGFDRVITVQAEGS